MALITAFAIGEVGSRLLSHLDGADVLNLFDTCHDMQNAMIEQVGFQLPPAIKSQWQAIKHNGGLRLIAMDNFESMFGCTVRDVAKTIHHIIHRLNHTMEDESDVLGLLCALMDVKMHPAIETLAMYVGVDLDTCEGMLEEYVHVVALLSGHVADGNDIWLPPKVRLWYFGDIASHHNS